MYFKNDKAEIEILIGGYTDTPEYYEESVRKMRFPARRVITEKTLAMGFYGMSSFKRTIL